MKRLASILAVAALSACGAAESLVLADLNSAASAVTRLTNLADSVARAGGDTALSHSYAALAEAIRVSGRISPVTITIDGVATEFLGTAQLSDYTLLDTVLRTGQVRSFIAFNRANPKEIVQLASAADSEPIRAYIYPTFAPFQGPSASLVYLDGKGGAFFGTSGSQKIGVVTSNVTCTATGAGPVIAIFPAPPQCTNADFTISFNAKVEASQFLASKNPATGSHTVAMASQPVLGARFKFSVLVNVGPPIVIKPNASLPATLTAKVDSLVTLTLTVTNPSSAPVQLDFSSGKHSDFTITDLTTGQVAWRASLGVMFTQVMSSQTLAPGTSLTFTSAWKPTHKGPFLATGELVSISHRAESTTSLVVP